MSEEKSKEQIAKDEKINTLRDEKIKALKVEIFDIIRQQEAFNYQVNQLQEAKKQRNEQLQKLELENITALQEKK